MKIVLSLALAFFVSVGSASAGETYLLSQTLGGVMAVEPVASSSDVVADCGSCRGSSRDNLCDLVCDPLSHASL